MAFNRLAVTLFKNDSMDDVQAILETCDESLYNETTLSGDTILHLALKSSTNKIYTLILNHLKKYPCHQKIICQENNEGWTPLHIAVGYHDFDCYKAVLDALGDKANKSCLAITKKNRLPLHFLKNHKNPDVKVANDLEFRMKSAISIPKIQDEIILESILSDQYDDALKENLTYAFIAMSYARRAVHQCSTHPDANNLSPEAFDKLVTKINKIRQRIKVINHQVSIWDNDDELSKLKNIVDIIKEDNKARCTEYGYLVMDALLRMGIPFDNLELFQIYNGDHVFVVLNRKLDSYPSAHASWGDGAIVIDGLIGDVYPANKIPEKLYDFICLKRLNGTRLNTLIPFKQTYHELNLKNSKDDINISLDYIREKRKLDESIFTANEIALIQKFKSKTDTKKETIKFINNPVMMNRVNKIEDECIRNIIVSALGIMDNDSSNESDMNLAIYDLIENSIDILCITQIADLKTAIYNFSLNNTCPLFFLRKQPGFYSQGLFNHTYSFYDKINTLLDNKYDEKFIQGLYSPYYSNSDAT